MRSRAAGAVLGTIARALERFHDLADRLVADPTFRRRAAAFPPTRGIARSRSHAVFDLSAGFVYSQILSAAVSLDLFDILAEGPKTVEDLARRMPLRTAAIERLLEATSGLRLTRRRAGGRYGLGPLGAPLVGNDGVKAMIAHHTMLYDDLRDPVALLQGRAETQLARYWNYDGDGAPDDGGAYSALMAASQPMISETILAAYPVRRHRRIMDLGGGDGSFLKAVARAAPESTLVLVDRAAVVARAQGPFETVAADIRRDALPSGADLVTLVRILHDHDDDDVRAILGQARAAIAPGGTLLVAEPSAGTAGAESVGAYFSFYLLAMGQGRPRSSDDVSALLRDAGFSHVRRRGTPNPVLASMILATG